MQSRNRLSATEKLNSGPFKPFLDNSKFSSPFKVGKKRGEVVTSRCHGSKIVWMRTNQKFTLKENSHCFKVHRSYSISFNLSKVGEIFWVESDRTVSKFRKKNENLCVVFTVSMKRVRESRTFHVAVMQQRLKSVMHLQSCRFAKINQCIFCRSRCRRRLRCLISQLL